MKRRDFIKRSSVIAASGAVVSTMAFPACTPAVETEILILGGGISGLYLAHLLDKAGRDYKILEGSSRFGGRLFTHEGIGNREVGGRGIGDKYIELMKLVDELDVELIDITDYMRSPTSIYFEGKMYKDWDDKTPNPRMLEYMLPKKGASLEALDQWYQTPHLDIKYSDYLKSLGRTEEELDIINISANYNDVRNTSAVNSLHSGAFRKFNGSTRIFNFKDGSKTLIDAVLSQLQGEVLTDMKVDKITDNGNSVTVTTTTGQTISAKKVVSTLPFSTLRDVELDCAVSSNQTKAIKELNYTKITQIHLAPTSNFWEEDDLHIDMWTDTKLERVMNTSAYADQHELACWVNGTGTAFFDGMSDREIEKYTLQELKRIRPSTEGNIAYVGTHKWGQYEYNKGAYAEFNVGQASLFEDMIRPAGNVHFAGEHTAKSSRGIEGAAESAVRVFKELI